MEYCDLLWHPNPKIQAVWQRAAVVELGCISNGVDGTNAHGTETMHFIPYGKFRQTKKRRTPDF